MRNPIAVFVMWLGVLLLPQPAAAHPASMSELNIDVQAQALTLTLQLPEEQLLMANPDWQEAQSTDLQAWQARLLKYVQGHLRAFDSQLPLATLWQPASVARCGLESCFQIQGKIDLTTVAGNQLSLRYDGITHRVRNHKVHVTVTYDHQPADAVLILDWKHSDIAIDTKAASHESMFLMFFNEGLMHIVRGADHLLFLTCLMLSVTGIKMVAGQGIPVRRDGLVKLCWLVSGFTVGHTIALIVGGLGWVKIPADITELAVAFTVTAAAIHLVLRDKPLSFLVIIAFGLIHGMAFTEVLAALPLQVMPRFHAIVGFNIGVEISQLIILLIAMPLLMWLQKLQCQRVIQRLLGSVAASIAMVWLGGRLYVLLPVGVS